MPNPPIKSGAELDWAMVEKAALAIVKQAQDSGFTPPEAVDIHLIRIGRVCAAMNSISDALKLRQGPDDEALVDRVSDAIDATKHKLHSEKIAAVIAAVWGERR